MTEIERAMEMADRRLEKSHRRLRAAMVLLFINLGMLGAQTLLVVKAEHIRKDAMAALARAQQVYQKAVEACKPPAASAHAVRLWR